MIGSTLAPFPILDPYETTGDLRDEWELPDELYEHERTGRSRAGKHLRHLFASVSPLARERIGLASHLTAVSVTLPKIDNEGTRS